MNTYKKISKNKNITYFLGKNKSNSSNYFVIADLSRIGKGFEEVVAWIDKNKNIEWNKEFEHLINKDIIKLFVISEL